MVKKGRNSKPPRNPHVVGSAHPGSKLTEKQASEIRLMYSHGAKQKELANQYGVVHQTISKIVNNKRYKNA
jgi:plasmid maintenance system antidote protein VapI